MKNDFVLPHRTKEARVDPPQGPHQPQQEEGSQLQTDRRLVKVRRRSLFQTREEKRASMGSTSRRIARQLELVCVVFARIIKLNLENKNCCYFFISIKRIGIYR